MAARLFLRRSTRVLTKLTPPFILDSTWMWLLPHSPPNSDTGKPVAQTMVCATNRRWCRFLDFRVAELYCTTKSIGNRVVQRAAYRAAAHVNGFWWEYAEFRIMPRFTAGLGLIRSSHRARPDPGPDMCSPASRCDCQWAASGLATAAEPTHLTSTT